MKPRVRVETRLPQELKDGLNARCKELGYESISALTRDFYSVVVNGYEAIPKINMLPNLDGILEPVLSQSKLGAQKNDFFEFMLTPHPNLPNYLIISSRYSEADFLDTIIDINGDYLSSDFIAEYHATYGYTPTPNEIKLYIKAFYNDSSVHKKQQEYFSAESRRIALEYGTAKRQVNKEP